VPNSNPHFHTRTSCPACGTDNKTTLLDYPYTAGPIREHLDWYYKTIGDGVEFEYLENASYILDECLSCHLVYQREIPGDDLLARLYDKWIHPSKAVQGSGLSNRGTNYYLWSTAQIAQGIEKTQKLPCDVKYFEFGMGWGHWCLLAKGFGATVYGLDLAESRSEHAKKQGIELLDWEQPQETSFDFINAEQVFEHLADPFDTLKRLTDILSPNGIIRISVPVGWDIKRRLAIEDWLVVDEHRNSLNAVAPLQHINCFNYDVLDTMANRLGFSGIDFDHPEFSARTPKDAVKLILLKFYRTLMPAHSQARLNNTVANARRRQSVIYLQRTES